MTTDSNDKNPKGTQWYNKTFYQELTTKIAYPEEDYQLLALPILLLHEELGRRLRIKQMRITWMHKTIDFSAISDTQLMHILSLRLGDV